MQKTRLRIRFTKCGDLRWISHRDLARVWERLLRRANLQLAFSEGFHPKPRISFPSALALGVEALDELVELEIVGTFELSQIEQDISRQLPAGMELLSVESLEAGMGKAKVAGFTFSLPVPSELHAAVEARISEIMLRSTFEIRRERKTIVCETADPYFELQLDAGNLIFRLPNMPDGSIKATDVLAELGLRHLLEEGALLQRTAVHLVEPASVVDSSHENIPSVDTDPGAIAESALISTTEQRPVEAPLD